jgi:hypothetical protein
MSVELQQKIEAVILKLASIIPGTGLTELAFKGTKFNDDLWPRMFAAIASNTTAKVTAHPLIPSLHSPSQRPTPSYPVFIGVQHAL